MSIDFLKERGTPLDRQRMTWREMVREPISKLDNDAFTRVRIILMNGIEQHMNRFLHAFARVRGDLQGPLAQIRRIEHHQQTAVNWLLGADHSPLETTIGFEQVAIEVTAAIAQAEPDPYLAQVHRFGLLEDFDHMYRFSALMDRLEGKDANNILQSYTDVLPGRPTMVEHRDPADDLRTPYDAATADPLSKLHAITILAGENQTRDYYMTIGPMFADPLARQLYAEIASIEEQHVTQYESIIDPNETWLEKWVLHEMCEVYNYYSCMSTETDPRVKALWTQFLDYELGHLHFVMDLYRRIEKKDPEVLLPKKMPSPMPYTSQRAFVRKTLVDEVDYRAVGPKIGALPDTDASLAYREDLHAHGVPSEQIAQGYRFVAGTELVAKTNGGAGKGAEVRS
ncbi:MAG: hypothetical protein HOW73_04495 [Polyangiaceae bacterium]|nr:hypothetical protein [Polyangiaceae bacterium]